MSNFLHVGSVIDYRNDRFATSGDHLDVRIIPKYGDLSGKHIDPSLRPELLNRIHIGDGDNRRGLTSYEMTSGFGPRDTGIPGASKYHKGHDYAIGSGNNIYVQGGTGYFSKNGVGVANISDAEGNPYELEFFHTNVGENSKNDSPTPNPTPTPARAEAKTKAQGYKSMSASQLNAEYDRLRAGKDVNAAKAAGLAMHKAHFNKP